MNPILSMILLYLACGISYADADALCVDALPDCRSYGADVCVKYDAWAKSNCAYTCKFCQGTPPPKECKDFVNNCEAYAADMCTDSGYRVWAEDHCPKFCGFCGIATGPPKPTGPPLAIGTTAAIGCEDRINFCLAYSPKACDDNTWATTYCKKWCKKC